MLRHGRKLETAVRLVSCHRNIHCSVDCEASRLWLAWRFEHVRYGLDVSEVVMALLHTGLLWERTTFPRMQEGGSAKQRRVIDVRDRNGDQRRVRSLPRYGRVKDQAREDPES
mgnify:CR=1 FL=1